MAATNSKGTVRLMPRPKQRTPELRDYVLEVALAMLSEEGIAGLTTRRIAARAGTSAAGVIELFTDKAGLVRAIFFEGFRQLGNELAKVPQTNDPIADLEALVPVFRRFCLKHPNMAQVMFSRPAAEFAPGPNDLAAAASVRETLVRRIRRCIDDGVLAGDPTDIAHVFLALAQGLAIQEGGGWLGPPASAKRRWQAGVRSVLDGFRR
jgi:AcrR family transcriptional regulator